MLGGLYAPGEGSIRESSAPDEAFSYRVVRLLHSLDPRSTGELCVEIPTPPRGGSKLDGEWPGAQSFEATFRRIIRTIRRHDHKLVTTDAESSVPRRLVLNARERGEGMPGLCCVVGGDRESRDTPGAVGMPGGPFVRDTQRAWGFIFDQERRYSSLLPHASTLPT